MSAKRPWRLIISSVIEGDPLLRREFAISFKRCSSLDTNIASFGLALPNEAVLVASS